MSSQVPFMQEGRFSASSSDNTYRNIIHCEILVYTMCQPHASWEKESVQIYMHRQPPFDMLNFLLLFTVSGDIIKPAKAVCLFLRDDTGFSWSISTEVKLWRVCELCIISHKPASPFYKYEDDFNTTFPDSQHTNCICSSFSLFFVF